MGRSSPQYGLQATVTRGMSEPMASYAHQQCFVITPTAIRGRQTFRTAGLKSFD